MALYLTTNSYKNKIFEELEDLKDAQLEEILRFIRLNKWRGAKFTSLRKGQKSLTAKELEKIRDEGK
ncbi:MAG: hypothetical protein JST67_08470 [Bacteroidetes bacterium]|nr:hypothetical protein [Bacteroidota bacterium]